MAQCRGKTKKGSQCKRDASSGSDFCTIHGDQEIREPRVRSSSNEWDTDGMLKAAIGFAMIGAIFLFGKLR